MHLSTFCAYLSPSTRGLFCARSLAPFHFNLNSMHYNHGFLNGNTNPLCQRGHFPPCTKLISIPHHPITPPHWLKQPTFSGAAVFFLYFLCMTRPKLMLLYVKCATGQVGDIQRPWQIYTFCNVLRYFLKIEDQGLLLLFCCVILFISLVLYHWITAWNAPNSLYSILSFLQRTKVRSVACGLPLNRIKGHSFTLVLSTRG